MTLVISRLVVFFLVFLQIFNHFSDDFFLNGLLLSLFLFESLNQFRFDHADLSILVFMDDIVDKLKGNSNSDNESVQKREHSLDYLLNISINIFRGGILNSLNNSGEFFFVNFLLRVVDSEFTLFISRW